MCLAGWRDQLKTLPACGIFYWTTGTTVCCFESLYKGPQWLEVRRITCETQGVNHLLPRILAFIPSWVTGRIEARARREVRSWIQDNATFHSYRYGAFRQLLIWGTDHPVHFTALLSLLAVAIAYLLAVQEVIGLWKLPAPVLKADFDVAAYAGVPWSVQATLVALVYPIVLSFIALMLQRKAHSTVSLRVYVLDSGVIPAGASSIGLLILIGAQYFASPYATPSILANLIVPLVVTNGSWLLMNVLLTGLFLSRTVRFIQEEEQRYVFKRVAVDIALRRELVSAVKQHIFVNAPTADWGEPTLGSEDDRRPRVQTLSVTEGLPQVRRSLKANAVLHDVHLRLLHLVAVLWKRRAATFANSRDGRPPTLIFPAIVGSEGFGERVLCSVSDGPSLSWFERFLVSTAFVFIPARSAALSLSTRKMLEEIGGEVEASAEQQRFGAAGDRLRDVLRLHHTLLLAGSVDEEGIAGNAATIGTSPYAWGDSSFDKEWLKPYRDIGRIAINSLENDPRLFRAIAAVPASLAAQLSPRPENLLINAQLVGTNLFYQLSGWWTRKADASLMPGATTFSGTLPAPLSKVYERAVIDFIGSWGHFTVDVRKEFTGGDAVAWHHLAGRALVYANHIEHSAQLFLESVFRGDGTGSLWLLESLLKWWGNRQFELECGDVAYDCRVRHVTLTLAEKDWEDAKNFLWDGEEPIHLEFAEKALNLAIRRYWESVRMYVVLLLVQHAGDAPKADCRELQYAAQLISGTPQRRGGTVDIRPLDDVDSFLTRLLGNVFGIETAVARIEAFADRLARSSKVPEVSGWIYSWSGTPLGLESMKRAQAVLLVALTSTTQPSFDRCKRLIERWWRDVDKLAKVESYLGDLCSEVSGTFATGKDAVVTLQGFLQKNHRLRTGRFGTAVVLRKLQAVAVHEREITLQASIVDIAKVRNLAVQVALRAFDVARLPAPISELVFRHGSDSLSLSISRVDFRKHYLSNWDSGQSTEWLSGKTGEQVREHSIARSFQELVRGAGVTPANNPELRKRFNASPSEMRTYLSTVAQQCAALKATGVKPVVLAGRSSALMLRPNKWGSNHWQCEPPAGVVVGPETHSHPRAISTINQIPVFEFPTPNQDCYVVSAERVKTLVVEGTEASDALKILWKEDGAEQLHFTLEWRARFA